MPAPCLVRSVPFIPAVSVPSRDWFRVLELPPDASMDAIKRSYRGLVKLWHPDRYAPGSSMQTIAQEKIKDINLAYEHACKIRGKVAQASAAQASSVRSAYASSESAEARPRRRATGRPETAGTPPPRPKRTPETAPPPPPKASRPPETADTEEKDGASVPPPPPKPAEHPPRARRFRPKVIWPFVVAILAGGAFVAVVVALIRDGPPAVANSGDSVLTPSMVRAQVSSLAAPVGRGPAARAMPADGAPSKAQGTIATAAPAERDNRAPTSLRPGIGRSAETDEAGEPSASDALASDALRDPVHASAGKGSAPAPSRPARASADLVHAEIDAAARGLDAFTIGTSREDVVKLQGPPDEATGTLLRYGSSVVFFSGDKVSGWRQVDVPLRSRDAVDLAYDQAVTFTTGSTKAEVILAQGKPDQASDSVFRYGSASVQFVGGRVVSWRQGVPLLKAHAAKDLAYDRAAAFTVGSTRAHVLEIQGVPDSATDTLLRYGAAVVRLENGRVVAWQDPLGILRTRTIPHLAVSPTG